MRIDVTQEPALAEALERLEAVVRREGRRDATEPLILMRADRPVGAYVPLDALDVPVALDDEALVVALSPAFREIVARSREQHRRGEAQSLDEVRRERGVTEDELAVVRSRQTSR